MNVAPLKRPAVAAPESQALSSPNTAMNLASLTGFGELLQTAITAGIRQARDGEPTQPPAVTLAEKLTLSLADASALAGLSQDFLRKAIHAG